MLVVTLTFGRLRRRVEDNIKRGVRVIGGEDER
jgi:hypothetical protein